MRKLIVAVAATAVVGGVAWAVVGGMAWAAVAGTGGGTTPMNCLDTRWSTKDVTTSSTTFQKVPGFADEPEAIFPIAVSVSAEVSGAPVEFRLLNTNIGSQTDVSEPGVSRFVPAGGGPDAFAYQWIEPNQSAAPHVTQLRLQWRSPSGHAIHLLSGDMAVQYDTTPGACTSTP
jgi:hypothetical protein